MAMQSTNGRGGGSSTYTTTTIVKYTLAEAIEEVCSGKLSPVEVYSQLPSELQIVFNQLSGAVHLLVTGTLLH
jgi:hypothetical protein